MAANSTMTDIQIKLSFSPTSLFFPKCNDPWAFSRAYCLLLILFHINWHKELFSLCLVCVKCNVSFPTCQSESVINNVVSYTGAQEQVGLVKPSNTRYQNTV